MERIKNTFVLKYVYFDVFIQQIATRYPLWISNEWTNRWKHLKLSKLNIRKYKKRVLI